ncbi:MAG TPA: Gfo/Idh/MocA family oxidoreductase [Acidimicrobiales bacterium]|jgi:predicted dehydrogenase
MFRLGFVGTGLISWAHGLGLQALIEGGSIDADITVVHDLDPNRARGFAEAVGARPVESAEAVVAESDAVWICTPTSAHRAAVELAVAAGRAIFCEKPLATDETAARDLVELVDGAGVAAQVGLVLRSAPVFGALRDLVQGGTLGRPMAAIFRDDQYFPIQGTYGSTWRSDVTQAGGGCLIEHSIHDVDILRFCFGEVGTVAGRTGNFAGHEGIEDRATLTMSFASGLEAHLTSVWHQILTRGSTRRVEVFFEQGMVSFVNEWIGPLRIETSAGTENRPCPPPEWVDALPFKGDVGLHVAPYVEADRAFVDAIAAGRAPEPSLHDALVAHQLVQAAYDSAADGGRPIPLG